VRPALLPVSFLELGTTEAVRRLLVITSLVLLGLPGGGTTAVLHSGLYGTVTRGPIAPVCAAEQPCTAPAVGSTIVFMHAGRFARVVVRADGSYRVRLVPGYYLVKSLRGRIEPTTVRVPLNHTRHINFSIDTGIR
jgi:hypothetical protein